MNFAHTPIGHFAYRALRSQFAVVIGLEKGVRSGERSEDVHDMRVAIRRFRAVADLFGEFLPGRFAALERELGGLANLLGGVRDLDVLLERIAEWGEFSSIEEELRKRRETSRAKVLRYFESGRYRRLLLSANMAFTRERVKGEGLVPVAIALPGLIRRRHRQFVRRTKGLRQGDGDKKFHRTRVAGKRLRYAVELVAETYAPEAGRYARRLAMVQDVLGKLQDCSTAIETLATMKQSEELTARYRERAEKLRRKFPKAYAKTERKVWRKLRKAMRSTPATELGDLPPETQA